jgi:hypothetical protein
MTIMKRYALLLLFTVLASGCGSAKNAFNSPARGPEANSRWNQQVARNYMAQGRYELAREYYLMALAANTDAKNRAVIAHELKSVDTMIQTQR